MMVFRDFRQHPTPEHRASSAETLLALNQVDERTLVRLSALSLPEIAEIKQQVADIFPAGNLPGLVLSGLASLKGRRITSQRAQEDLNTLFQGASLVPQALYSVLIGGPAVVLHVYQMLLRLVGKSLDEAFPEGIWQFYTQFGLREDSARFTVETTAYYRERPRNASLVDDITAWLMTAIYTLFDSDGLNSALWTEWTTLRLLLETAEPLEPTQKRLFSSLVRGWLAVRPYRTSATMSYAEARTAAFDQYIKSFVDQLPADKVQQIARRLEELAREERQAYQRQMSLLAYLKPHRYYDERIPIPLWRAKVGLIWRGHIYLFDLCAQDAQERPLGFTLDGGTWPLTFDEGRRPLDAEGRPLALRGGWLYRPSTGGSEELVGYLAPVDPARIKGKVAALLQTQRLPSATSVDLRLVAMPRSQQEQLRGLLPSSTRAALDELAYAPILINWDEQDNSLPLGELRRQARRGVGDHPLTILRTPDSVIFDLSPIFFDGPTGLALAEAMTNQAVKWCQQLTLIGPQAVPTPPALNLIGCDAFEAALISPAPAERPVEVNAETAIDDLEPFERTRLWLRQRGVVLTINDLLLLARIRQAADYRPNKEVARAIAELPEGLRKQVVNSLEATSVGVNPSLLILMDASLMAPRERTYPATFRNPLSGLIGAYNAASAALDDYNKSHKDDQWATFSARRDELFAYLNAFGQVLDAIKAIAMRGESAQTATTRLLAHLPASMQSLLISLPERVEILGEVLKGEEVFSNMGRAARGTSVARYEGPRDDGHSKVLVWGILTDGAGRMRISLRDFRPHVAPLVAAGHTALANALAHDYVESYAATLTSTVQRLGEIATAEDIMRWE